jgi:nitrogenase molybdenum-iron protein alpha/beta subunit
MARAKKSRSKSRTPKRAHGVTAAPKNPEELQDARNRVINVIVDSSVDMTKGAVRSVNEKGNISALRFLWEIAGMFPTSASDDVEEQESVAKSLIKNLGLYEEFPTIHGSEGDGKGDVESE